MEKNEAALPMPSQQGWTAAAIPPESSENGFLQFLGVINFVPLRTR